MYNKAALNMFASLQLLKLVLFISVASNILPQHIRFKLQIYFLHTASINIFFSSSQEYICLQTTSSNILFSISTSTSDILAFTQHHKSIFFTIFTYSKYLQYIEILIQANIESYTLDTCKIRTAKRGSLYSNYHATRLARVIPKGQMSYVSLKYFVLRNNLNLSLSLRISFEESFICWCKT